MADKDQYSRINLQRQVQCLNGLHIQVVGRLIHQHDVGVAQGQFAEQHPDLFNTGNHRYRFFHIIVGKQHAPQGAAHHLFIFIEAIGPRASHFEEALGVARRRSKDTPKKPKCNECLTFRMLKSILCKSNHT